MKNILAVLLALLCVGCGGPKPVEEAPPAPAEGVTAQAMAEELAALLPPPPGADTEELTVGSAALLLDLEEGALAEAAGYFSLDHSTTAQLMVLRTAVGEAEQAAAALEDRLELLRQTAEASAGGEPDSRWSGCLLTRGDWALLAVADGGSDAEDRVEEARELFLSKFQQ